MKTRITILLALLAVLTTLLPAQSGGRGRQRTTLVEVRVESNVAGADIRVNDESVGRAPTRLNLATGQTYTFTVTADGYRPWTQSVAVSGPQTVYANLDPITYTLTVTSNVPAQVFLSGEGYGNTTLQQSLTPGTYNVTVRANGYLDYNTTVTLDGNRTVNAQLQPANARVGVQVPSQITADIPGAAEMVTVFVDGRPVPGTTFEVGPGRHTIRVRSGGLQYEFVHDFAAGGSYTIVPSFSATIR